MGIFSLFGKKDRPPATTPADKDSTRKKRDESAARTSSSSEAGRAQLVQRKVARATAMKIDAIESEMSSEFVKPSAPGAPGSLSPNTSPAVLIAEKSEATQKKDEPAARPAGAPGPVPMGSSTQFLLGGETVLGNASAVLAASETAPAIEEAAILYANGQTEMVENVLQNAIQDNETGPAALTIWAMLFDLYHVTGKREQFDNLSIEYANKFETSPPAWSGADTEPEAMTPATPTKTPTVPFSGKLDGNIVKLLERAQNLAEHSKILRLEFNRVSEVDPIGCGILLSVLNKLQKSGHDLILVGALELAAKVKAILEVGRRDETEAPWLLLLEILRLLNLEKDFEETSIDYCVTFEVSPPAFVAPKNKVTTAIADTAPSAQADSEYFMMPPVIEGRIDQLLAGITAYAAEHNPAIIDCSRLTRVDFGAIGQLLSGLAPHTCNGKAIEFHDVNHLVSALFGVMGMKDIVRVVPRKN